MEISNAGEKQWEEIKRIYFETFPKSERKPFFTIRHFYNRIQWEYGDPGLWGYGVRAGIYGAAKICFGKHDVLFVQNQTGSVKGVFL